METGFFSPLSLEYWVTRLSYDAFDESSFFTVSEWLSDYIRKRTGHSAVIIPPGIDHEVFFPRSRTPHSGKRVLFLSRPSKWRGVEVLIDAMNIVCNRIPDVELIAVGGSSKTYVAPCPISYVHPTNSELADLYASCDVFVLPSLLEGLPVPPLEAMACGGAVVLTDCLGTRDYALPGENCLMVPPGDSCAMAESIINVLEDDGVSLKLRRNGPTTAEPWTYDRMTRVFVESLEKNSPLD